VAGSPPKASHPQALGSGPATPKRPRNQKQKQKRFGFWGWPVAGSPPKALRVAEPPPDRPYGVVETTPRLLGVVRPPPKPLTFFLFCFFGLLGVVGPPPKPTGVVRPPQIGQGGGWSHPLDQ
jgi:hypothetical protein